MAAPADERLREEFDALLALAGLRVPPDRRAELLVAFADLRSEVARLYAAPLAPSLEPARVFRTAAPAVER